MILLLLGIALVALEFLVKGMYIIWFGIGTLVAGVICLILGDPEWQVQAAVLSFCVLMMLAVSRRFSKSSKPAPGKAMIARQKIFLGRQAYLKQPIVGGKGTIRLDEATWPVRGPDLPKGTIVEIVRVEPDAFVVAKADSNLS